MSEDDTTMPQDGIGDDVRLTVTTAAGDVLSAPLTMLAIAARVHGPELLPFLYRTPADPDDPDDEPGPLRRARLMIVEDTDFHHASGICRLMETRTCPSAGTCTGPCARFESNDPTPWKR